MGTFAGHALPGSFFILFGIWWTVQTFNRYFSSQKKDRRFVATVTFPCVCLIGRVRDWPVEALLKLFLVSVGFSLEIYTGFRDGEFKFVENGQHATMFLFFGLTGVIDLLLYFRVSFVPKDTDYVSLLMALSIEGLLFRFHLKSKGELDNLYHILLIFTIIANFLAVMAEMRFRHNALILLSRAYFTILQGTWFWQIGYFNCYPPPSQVNEHTLMFTTMLYCWHCCGVFLSMLAIGWFIARYQRWFGGSYEKLSSINTDDTERKTSDCDIGSDCDE